MMKDYLLTIYLQPGAKQSAICGTHNGHLKIKLNAPPVDGKANEGLILFLSELMGVSKSSIEIVSGQKSRLKRLKIKGVSEEMVIQKLGRG